MNIIEIIEWFGGFRKNPEEYPTDVLDAKVAVEYINQLITYIKTLEAEVIRLRNNCPLSEMPHHHYHHCKKCDEDTIF